ncbi:surf-like protein [Recurvomyces mirabilis]|nr:surf-like protein [Recurvomyces mirabilis]
MDRTRPLWRALVRQPPTRTLTTSRPPFICQQCLHFRPKKPLQFRPNQRRHQSTHQQPADDPTFKSIVDNPPTLVRSGRKHNRYGLALLASIPLISFGLGCWQVQRLTWKTDLVARFEDRLVRDPLPLPPQIDPDMIHEFDYRRVYARGVFRHEGEMLIGPRLFDGEDGFLVVTPLDREGEFRGFEGNSTVLVNRGWISKEKAAQGKRREGLPRGDVVVQGLLREPWKKNSFTPENDPARNLWHFPDVYQMAEHVGSQPVWIEETMVADLLMSLDRKDKGVPIGRPAEFECGDGGDDVDGC